ncbi:group II intron reverse transcriptase/maturase [compost metagenome]
MVIDKVNSIKKLSPQTKRIVRDVLENFSASGGRGLPRGLALSATLSEIMMEAFDREITSTPGVFYYARYVDDIIVITCGSEQPKPFLKKLSRQLPSGLQLNRKKESISPALDSTPFKVTPLNPTSPEILSFEYLGYGFKVYEPTKRYERRDVVLDVADSKIKKIKTRIVKAIIDYCRGRDFELLESRFKFLTSNFSIPDINRGGYRLAGIYHNYHRIDGAKSLALDELDRFLKLSVLSGAGKLFNDFYLATTSVQRRRLAAFSFKRGFNERTYLYFSRTQLALIGDCWKYA